MNNIAKLRKMHGLTQNQLAKIIGVSTSTVAMWETGRRKPDYHRIVRICGALGCSFTDLTGEEITAETAPEDRQIPVLGYVRAGIPNTAVQNIIGYVNISDDLRRTGEMFALKIRGSSMEPKMSDGDTVIVRKQNTAENGQTVVVLRGGDDATVKRIYFQNDGITLMPTNPEFTPIHYSQLECRNLPVTIVGVVVELRCRYI